MSPEDQLRNVAAVVLEQTTPTRRHNGQGRNPSYPVDQHSLALSARQLAEMAVAYLDARLAAIDDSGIPF